MIKDCDVEIKIGAHGSKSEVLINGKQVPYCYGVEIHSDVNDLTRVYVKTRVVKPFIVNFNGDVEVECSIVSKKLALEVYESLKSIFEKGE